MPAKITLKPHRDRSVRRRHPWIFSGAVASGEGEFGETVEVADAAGETLGYGSYSPLSQIRVRMLSFGSGRAPDAESISGLVAASVARRRDFFAADSFTNACRLINAEADGLPGVVADRYGEFAVCQFTSAGAEKWKREIAAALMRCVPGCRGVSERTDAEVRQKEGLEVGGESAFAVLSGEPPPELVEIFEGGIRFLVDVRNGHKTGFYLDQRNARRQVGALAAGRSVLNCFCYTGGFGLAAAAGGASHVTQVDVSADALALARRNAELTGVADRVEEVEADVFRYLRTCRDSGRKFDLIVLDPPKFAASKSQIAKAARGYKDINLLAMKLLNPDGILATFSCSGSMTADLFDTVLAEAAVDSGSGFQTIARTLQAEDHPVALNFPEGMYLKGVIMRKLA